MVGSTPQRRFKLSWVLIDELAVGPAPRAEHHLEYLGLKASKLFLACLVKTRLHSQNKSNSASNIDDSYYLITKPIAS